MTMNTVFEYYDTIDRLTDHEDVISLEKFTDERLDELLLLLKDKISSNPTENEILKTLIMSWYAFEYKQKSLEEVSADICTLLGAMCTLELIQNKCETE